MYKYLSRNSDNTIVIRKKPISKPWLFYLSKPSQNSESVTEIEI